MRHYTALLFHGVTQRLLAGAVRRAAAAGALDEGRRTTISCCDNELLTEHRFPRSPCGSDAAP